MRAGSASVTSNRMHRPHRSAACWRRTGPAASRRGDSRCCWGRLRAPLVAPIGPIADLDGRLAWNVQRVARLNSAEIVLQFFDAVVLQVGRARCEGVGAIRVLRPLAALVF